MPEYTNSDRMMIEAEATLWNCHQILSDLATDSAFSKKIAEIRAAIRDVAGEMRSYNDQFETEDS